jgi:NADH-quinone oxidoreductase subunit N
MFMCFVAICFIAFLYSEDNLKDLYRVELPIIALFVLFGADLIVMSSDSFLLYIAIEIQSLSLYIFVALKRYSNLSHEAAIKYFITGSYASCPLLLGVYLIHKGLSTTSFTSIEILCLTTTCP